MTLDTYERATEILKRKNELEKKLNPLNLKKSNTTKEDIQYSLEDYKAFRDELFMLGQEFAML